MVVLANISGGFVLVARGLVVLPPRCSERLHCVGSGGAGARRGKGGAGERLGWSMRAHGEGKGRADSCSVWTSTLRVTAAPINLLMQRRLWSAPLRVLMRVLLADVVCWGVLLADVFCCWPMHVRWNAHAVIETCAARHSPTGDTAATYVGILSTSIRIMLFHTILASHS
jgi:hypothetical protein